MDAVDSDNEQDIDNLMNDSDTEFIASDDVELVDQDDDMRSTTTTPAANVHFTLDDQPADGATTSNQSNLDVIDTIMAEDVEDEHKMKKALSTAVGKPVTTSNQQKTRSKQYIANKLGSESRNPCTYTCIPIECIVRQYYTQ